MYIYKVYIIFDVNFTVLATNDPPVEDKIALLC